MGKHKKLITGIYMIQNVINKKVYIGSSTYVQRRIHDHKRKLRGNYHLKNKELQESWNEYGESAFIFHILEEFDSDISEKELLEHEYKWIIHYRANENEFGFNKKDPRDKSKIGEIHRKPIERGKKVNKVVGINTLNKEIIIYKNPYEASQSINGEIKRIHECLNYWKYDDEGRRGRKRSYRGYMFVYERFYDPNYNYLEYKIPTKERKPKQKKELIRIPRTYCLPKNAKPVRLEHIETGEFLYFSSVREAVRALDLVESKARLSVTNEYKKHYHRNYWFKFIDLEEFTKYKSLDDILVPEKSRHLENTSSQKLSSI